VPHQLFTVIHPSNSSKLESSVRHLYELIDEGQREEWLILFSGGVPKERLRWNGTLQEAYYLFNELRKLARDSSSIIHIQTKNGGLDWIKVNKVIVTKYGNIQKESRPSGLSVLSSQVNLFIRVINQF